MGDSALEKSRALLAFLKAQAGIRRPRVPTYTGDETVLWVADLPTAEPECRCPLSTGETVDSADVWLELRKPQLAQRPAEPREVRDWVRAEDLDNPRREPELLPQITVPPKRNGEDASDTARILRLEDHPRVEEAWLEYLVEKWLPWAEQRRRCDSVQVAYDQVDYVRRTLEEAEERYELVLGLGLLQWRDPKGVIIRRHLLTAPAEVTLDADRGVLTVTPAASFAGFRLELDMLDSSAQPRLDRAGLDALLEDLDVEAWNRPKVGVVLRAIANHLAPDAQVYEDDLHPLPTPDETPRVVYAPAFVLRQRRSTAYEDLVERLGGAADAGSLETTAPWDRLVSEGEPGSPRMGDGEDGHDLPGVGRLYFPLPVNEEQRRIAERLSAQPCVLVKGPPGTGKSHTIANLICHLLAHGERVLVTAHAPRALAVLRNLLPEGVRHLCVTAHGSSRDDQEVLKESISRILSRCDEWPGPGWAADRIAELEGAIQDLERQAAETDRRLRDYREQETRRHSRPGSYEGTAGQIARQLSQEKGRLGWLPELPDCDAPCPLDAKEIRLLAEVHTRLTPEWEAELALDVGDFELPSPEDLRKMLRALDTAECEAANACEGLPQEHLSLLDRCEDSSLERCLKFLSELDEADPRARRTLGPLAEKLLGDLLCGAWERWDTLREETAGLLKSATERLKLLGDARVEIIGQTVHVQMLGDARRLLDHFGEGGRSGLWLLAPRVVRHTRYLQHECRVDGLPCRDATQLAKLVAFLELQDTLEQLRALWPSHPHLDDRSPASVVDAAQRLVHELGRILDLFRRAPDALSPIPAGDRPALTAEDTRAAWRRRITCVICRRQVRRAQAPLDRALADIQCVPAATAHPCIGRLAQAVEERDPDQYTTAWQERQRVRDDKQRLACYVAVVCKLLHALPAAEHVLNTSKGQAEWKDRLVELERAWHWSACRTWLRRICDKAGYDDARARRERLGKHIDDTLRELAELRAWNAFLGRLSDRTRQNLTAWAQAVARIGKGTGRYAYRHRRAAQQYLAACLPEIPAWIMPLHRLWDTIEGTAGVFDTVIVDEASQAGIEALLLLLLAKRIVVVGDDRQNSPEAVGVAEDDIARLAREHLRQFRFRDEFRPDQSLYDHALRAFGSVIALREHFRCVPEIIRFSNDLCYRDVPLIPLRQPPPERLAPLKATFVTNGFCQGDGQRLVNQPEAEQVVDAIARCLEDEAYDGKTMGVIVLQGHAQAELIDRLLSHRLPPKVREERKLRCGVPATFQGDERDVVFLSLVLAPNHPTRALTALPDQRRFNVAMSRARDQAWLFHSVKTEDLSREDLRSQAIRFFSSAGHWTPGGPYEERERLERAAADPHRRPGDQPSPYDSWFEVEVALQLLRRGYRVLPQHHVAGYRIDLVVEGSGTRLAIECDGDLWHGPERYDHDLARQRQLERVGWVFARVRESDFYADPERAIAQVVEACDQLGIEPWIHATPNGDEETVGEPGRGEPNHPSPAHPAQSADTGPAEVELEGTATESGPFSGYSEACSYPDPREASLADVKAALMQIIERDGPLSRAAVSRLYVRGCPALQRCGKAVRQTLNRTLGAMLRSGEILQEDELGDRSPEGLILRPRDAPRVVERPAGQRDFLEIPPSELRLAVDRLRAQPGYSDASDEIVARALLAHYGFRRATETRLRYIRRVLAPRESSKAGLL